MNVSITTYASAYGENLCGNRPAAYATAACLVWHFVAIIALDLCFSCHLKRNVTEFELLFT